MQWLRLRTLATTWTCYLHGVFASVLRCEEQPRQLIYVLVGEWYLLLPFIIKHHLQTFYSVEQLHLIGGYVEMSRKDSVGVLSWFGVGAKANPQENDEKAAVRALPSNWYTSAEMFELERRAIFSRKWQLITHKNRFQKAGDWLKYEITGFSIVLARDREGKINGFHNVCRHRAYPVVTSGEEGTSRIFSCKYHGWSYGINGKLAKAPGYDTVQGFNKEHNGLFPIHVRIDKLGFVWINMDGKKTPEVPWEEDFAGVDTQKRYEQFNFDDYEFDHIWSMDGDYNWKILADNYNECYHCATTHPDIGALADLQSYDVQTRGAQIIHDAATTDEQRANGLVVASTYYFPNVSTNVS